ncbi:MAG: fructose-bisphosphatase class III [Candidatus Izemoplasma sp.]
MYKIFIVSDIHGYFSALIDSLLKSGYNDQDKSHHLLVIGDLFDRGNDSKEVYNYLSKLTKNNSATIIMGNHDKFLIDFLEGNFKKTTFNILHNGFGKTIESFLNLKVIDQSKFELYKVEINRKYPELYHWLLDFKLYIETPEYIFVHGGINPNQKDWRNSKLRDFLWGREYLMDRVPGKIVVAGHQRVAQILYKKDIDYKKLFETNSELFDILYLDGKILIDRFVEMSNELNVLVLELPILEHLN